MRIAPPAIVPNPAVVFGVNVWSFGMSGLIVKLLPLIAATISWRRGSCRRWATRGNMAVSNPVLSSRRPPASLVAALRPHTGTEIKRTARTSNCVFFTGAPNQIFKSTFKDELRSQQCQPEMRVYHRKAV